MPRRETRPYGHLIAHQTTTPTKQTPLPRPRHVRVTATTYDGHTITIDATATHHAGPWIAITATYEGWGKWTAWVHRDACVPLD